VKKRRDRKAGKAYKTGLLDEACEGCGYERKHAAQLLSGTRTVSGGRRRKADYGSSGLAGALKRVWLRSGQLH
jgi:hypothetical protein